MGIIFCSLLSFKAGDRRLVHTSLLLTGGCIRLMLPFFQNPLLRCPTEFCGSSHFNDKGLCSMTTFKLWWKWSAMLIIWPFSSLWTSPLARCLGHQLALDSKGYLERCRLIFHVLEVAKMAFIRHQTWEREREPVLIKMWFECLNSSMCVRRVKFDDFVEIMKAKWIFIYQKEWDLWEYVILKREGVYECVKCHGSYSMW